MIQNCISQNDTESALNELTKFLKSANSSKWLNSTTILKSKYNKLKKEKIDGVLSQEEIEKSISKINVSILEISQSAFENEINLNGTIPEPSNQKLIKNVMVKITVDRDYNSYSSEEKEALFETIRKLLELESDITIKSVERGSVVIKFELDDLNAKKLIELIENGALKKHEVLKGEIINNVLEKTVFIIDDNVKSYEDIIYSFNTDNVLETSYNLYNIQFPNEIERKEILLFDLDLLKMKDAIPAIIEKSDKKNKIMVSSSFLSYNDHMELLKLGVDGILNKNETNNKLIEAIREVSNSGAYFSEKTLKFLSKFSEKEESEKNKKNLIKSSLTNREQEILKLIAQQKTGKEIAEELLLSIHTVYKHRKNIMRKTEAKHTADLIKFYHSNKRIS